ncbi:hypothetical protein F4774DRAFT_425129 [Daldinia eschscholtzii]|nr:hypothetical protein F4774DRAFT_425129 [Daldinia eschscholtzii]
MHPTGPPVYPRPRTPNPSRISHLAVAPPHHLVPIAPPDLGPSVTQSNPVANPPRTYPARPRAREINPAHSRTPPRCRSPLHCTSRLGTLSESIRHHPQPPQDLPSVSESPGEHPDAVPDLPRCRSRSQPIDPTRNTPKSIPNAPTVSPDSLEAPGSPGGHPRTRGTARGGQPLVIGRGRLTARHRVKG